MADRVMADAVEPHVKTLHDNPQLVLLAGIELLAQGGGDCSGVVGRELACCPGHRCEQRGTRMHEVARTDVGRGNISLAALCGCVFEVASTKGSARVDLVEERRYEGTSGHGEELLKPIEFVVFEWNAT